MCLKPELSGESGDVYEHCCRAIDRSLAVGTPAKVIRHLSDEEVSWKVSGTRSYQDLTGRSLRTLKEVPPLAAVEADRKRIAIDVEGVVPLVATKRD